MRCHNRFYHVKINAEEVKVMFSVSVLDRNISRGLGQQHVGHEGSTCGSLAQSVILSLALGARDVS